MGELLNDTGLHRTMIKMRSSGEQGDLYSRNPCLWWSLGGARTELLQDTRNFCFR